MAYPIIKQPGDTVTISATIVNVGNLAIAIDISSGLNPIEGGGYLQPFPWVRNIFLNPGDSYNFSSSLKVGTPASPIPWNVPHYSATITVWDRKVPANWIVFWSNHPDPVIKIPQVALFEIQNPLVNGG